LAQAPNPEIPDFEERVKWIAKNLDPNPTYRRFVYDHNDIFTALEQAVERQEFYQGQSRSIPGRRQWQNALVNNRPSRIFINWLYILYPDLRPSQLETFTLDDFFAAGREIERHRRRWQVPIRYFSECRPHLAQIAKKYYREVDFGSDLDLGGISFPLLVKKNWIRKEPLCLTGETETEHLTLPDRARTFDPKRLPGLKGDYVSYKAALAYATRKLVKPEPQHNGEIFCADSTLHDAGGFIGFKYSLSRYFVYINTCEVLGAELADWVLSHESDEAPPLLPFRGEPGDAFNLEQRASYPGINCLSVFINYSNDKLGRGNYFLLHKRDETQLEAQNTIHVVPAGGHQGFSKGAQADDTAIWRTMVREFAEELFDMEDLYRQRESWEDFLQYKSILKIRDVFFGSVEAAAKAYLHGFGLDPVTLKPEVLITIVINWEIVTRQWPNVRLKFNWELQGPKKISRCAWVPLSKENLLAQARGGVQSIGNNDDTFLGTLPAGAACMIQTARHYDHLGLPNSV
jgi:hypothetical protein